MELDGQSGRAGAGLGWAMGIAGGAVVAVLAWGLTAASRPTRATSALTDGQIARIVLTANSGDSARGEEALQRAEAAEIRDFGQTMATDHGALNRQAAALATRLGIHPAPSAADSDLVRKVTALGQALSAEHGAQWDRTYIGQEVAIHRLVLDDLDRVLIPESHNGALKGLLRTARAAVAAHLQRAVDLKARLQ